MKVLAVVIKDIDCRVAGRDIYEYTKDTIEASKYLQDIYEAACDEGIENIREYASKEGYDAFALLPVSYPIRNATDIDNMIDMLEGRDGDTALIEAVIEIAGAKQPLWCKRGGAMSRLDAGGEVYKQCPAVTVYAVNPSGREEAYTLSGYSDISIVSDEYRCTQLLRLMMGLKPNAKPMEIVFDIDGVVAVAAPNLKYDEEEPIMEVIEIINRLHDNGHTIIMLTARGYKTGIDWSQATTEQFARWGLKYDELKFGKPNGDIYVDDKMLSVRDLKQFSMLNI